MFLKYRSSDKELVNQILDIINDYLDENEFYFDEDEVDNIIENLVEEELIKYGLLSARPYQDYNIQNWIVEQILDTLLECCFEECDNFLINDYDVDKLKISINNTFVDYRVFA